jgi:hypothetical protein
VLAGSSLLLSALFSDPFSEPELESESEESSAVGSRNFYKNLENVSISTCNRDDFSALL